MGAGKKLKAGLAGDKKRQAPLRIPKRQSQQATKKASPPLPPAPPKKPPPWLTCTETQPRIVHPVQPPERKAKKIRKLFGKPVDKPRKECYNGNATGCGNVPPADKAVVARLEGYPDLFGGSSSERRSPPASCPERTAQRLVQTAQPGRCRRRSAPDLYRRIESVLPHYAPVHGEAARIPDKTIIWRKEQ